MSAKKFARVLLPSAVFLALVWSLAIPAPAYAVLTPQIVSVNPGSGSQVGSNVCITARIEQDFDYRAMRIRFGNEGWQESSELVFERCFGTGHLSPGWYEIRVEADRLGGNWSNITSATQSYELTPQPQPTQPPPPPKGPDVEFTLTPSGGADIGTKVTIEVWVDSTNPGAIRITVPCGGVPVEHTTPHFKTTWDTDGCGKGTETVRVCARDVNDPNWANQTCSERQYTLSSPPLAAPTAKFWADATSIQSGQCTWLRWTTTNASIVDIDGDVVAASGEMQVCPTITKYYSLKAQGDGGVATRSLGINVYNQAPPPEQSVASSFQTGDVIDIEGRIHIIVNGERRWVPNEASLDALGLGRDKVNNKGFSNSELKTIPPGPDIPDINRDYSGFMAFKNAYFPNTVPIDPATATPVKGSSVGPTPTPVFTQPQGATAGIETSGESADNNWYVAPDPAPSGSFLGKFLQPLFDLLSGEAVASSGSDIVPRNPFSDPDECVGYVGNELCRDALYWLSYEAYAFRWVEMANSERAKSLGVLVYTTPREGDIAVWSPGCDEANKTWGHVAYVTFASGNFFSVKESNWDGNFTRGTRENVQVLSCMRFIRNGCNIPEELLNPPEPEQPKGETELTYPSWLPEWLNAAYDWLFGRNK